jgi:hypothetical protein
VLKNLTLFLSLITLSCTPEYKNSVASQSENYAGDKKTVAIRFQKHPLKLPVSIELPQAVWISSEHSTPMKFKIVNLSQKPLPTFLLRFKALSSNTSSAPKIEGLDLDIEVKMPKLGEKFEKTIDVKLPSDYNFAVDYIRLVPEVEPVALSINEEGVDKNGG